MGQRSSRSSGTAAASAPPEPQDHGSIDYGRVMHMLHNQLRNRKQRAAAAAPAAAETAAAGGDGGGEAAGKGGIG